MKKLTLLAIGIAVAATSQANFKFHFAYGDAALAALNNSTVGTLIASGTNLRVPTAGANFSVQIWAEKISSSTKVASGASVIVAYDVAPVANSTTSYSSYSSFMHQKIRSQTSDASGSIVNDGTLSRLVDINTGEERGPGSFSVLSKKFRGAFTGNTISPRMFGLSAQFGLQGADGTPVGFGLPMAMNERVRICDMKFTSNLVAGQSYGFAQGEAGLNLYATTIANGNGGGCSWMGNYATSAAVGSRLNLTTVVPEPSSALAVAIGALALLRRNRRASKEVRS
ncbi:MAG: PEP-CTERM sorting domain-containing protein [Chthonomonas sp.]|nr:PEP-CTERM sorting domain-containing protein [Chthonomonas sp.]